MSLKSLFLWYSAASAAALVVIVFIVNVTSYSTHYWERLDRHQRAQLYLQQAVCRDDHIKAKLGDYNKCRDSEHTLNQSVRWLALTDAALDAAHWMGFSGSQFSDTYMFKLYSVGVLILVLGLWLGIFRIGAQREIVVATTPLLPTVSKKYD